jgi:protein-tyrosine-phosphatase
MAEGLLKALGNNDYEVYSAGISPSRVNPYAIIALKSILIKIKSSNQ